VTLAALSGELWRMEYLESTELRLPIVAMPSLDFHRPPFA